MFWVSSLGNDHVFREYSRASKAEDKEKEREKRAEERFKSALVFTYF